MSEDEASRGSAEETGATAVPIAVPSSEAATEDLWRIYGVINDWIRFADAKAGALLAANAVIVGAALGTLKDHRAYLAGHLVIGWVAAAGFAGLIVSAFCCLECIRPKTARKGVPSFLYFDSISREFPRDPDAFRRAAFRELSDPEQAHRQISRQVWVNAGIASRKHRWIAWSVWPFGFGLLCGLIVAVAVAVSG